MSSASKAVGALILIIGLLLIVAGSVLAFEQNVINEAQYRRVIGDYALNAYDSPTFQQAITYLQKFNDSMNNQGLTPDLYNSPWSWDQTPSNKMDFQYSYTTQMVARAYFYINYTATQHAGQLSDVYNQALANFRQEMTHDGPLDWVAHDAWMIRNGFYWNNYYAGGLIASGAIFAFVGGLVLLSGDEDD